MTRLFRGATYRIEIRKPRGVQRGKVTVTVDGKRLPSNVIPPHGDGRTHSVRVDVG
jgi:cellobiose phosphorylase